MEFARKGVTIFEIRILALVVLLTSILFVAIDMWFLTLFGFCFSAFLIFLLPIGVLDERISVNENGISCYTKRALCWSYRWEEILELRKGGRPNSALIVLKPECYKNNVKNQSTIADFELGRLAKNALAIYCKCPTR